ncbi:hypothetical protein BU14_0076s0041 [Porphyra umbilicalis]|uniref:Uncharacterized protein n=1 Tax=Porphyra umbilicalis TaxID=2786 RepID=A0A1X6PFF9_PORUM|nr:hypothetical protein BU14_0076s0041 [Porphyra umbilicalis]|eukprot:OSX79485.1 hypothetical protein BU14_0076s0041 [Porphyra umbilicalis]
MTHDFVTGESVPHHRNPLTTRLARRRRGHAAAPPPRRRCVAVRRPPIVDRGPAAVLPPLPAARVALPPSCISVRATGLAIPSPLPLPP